MVGFNIDITAKKALQDAKDRHARRWQTKEGTYRQKEQLLPDVRDNDIVMADSSFFLLVAAWVSPRRSALQSATQRYRIITRTGQLMQLYKPKQIQTKQRQQQIPNCGGREDETDARAVVMADSSTGH